MPGISTLRPTIPHARRPSLRCASCLIHGWIFIPTAIWRSVGAGSVSAKSGAIRLPVFGVANSWPAIETCMSAPGPCRCAFAVAAFPKPSDSTIWHTMARRRHECRRGTQSACATYNSSCAFRDLPGRVRQHSLPHVGLHRPGGLHALALAGAQLHVLLQLLLRTHHAHLRRAETGRLEPLGPLHHLQEQRALPAARIAAALPDHLLLAAGGLLPAGRGDRMHDAAPAR